MNCHVVQTCSWSGNTTVERRQGPDGWFPQVPPGEHLDRALGIIATAATDAGRESATIGMEGRVNYPLAELGLAVPPEVASAFV